MGFIEESENTEKLQPYLACIDSYLKPTAKNMLALFLQMVNMLQKISCEVENADRYRWGFLMFTKADFQMLPGIAVVDARGNTTPGPAPVIPKHPGAVPSGNSSIITVTTYNKERELFRQYEICKS